MTTASNSSIQWFVARDGQQTGPFDDNALRAMAASGALHPSHMVWRDGWPSWQAASSVAGFANAPLQPPPLPMPPIVPQYASYTTTPPNIGESASMRMLIPVDRSGWAIAAGYLGLFSVLAAWIMF